VDTVDLADILLRRCMQQVRAGFGVLHKANPNRAGADVKAADSDGRRLTVCADGWGDAARMPARDIAK